MKIFYSEIFGDYLFEVDGLLQFMLNPSSLHPHMVGWFIMWIKPTDLKLIAEVEQ